MNWELTDDRPIYAQLVEQIQLRILAGAYPPGSKLPSVRDLAAEATVNPNTMQRALSDLEREGLVFTQRTSGRFITEDQTMIEQMKANLAHEQITDFIKGMQQIGFDLDELVAMVEKTAKEMKGNE